MIREKWIEFILENLTSFAKFQVIDILIMDKEPSPIETYESLDAVKSDTVDTK